MKRSTRLAALIAALMLLAACMSATPSWALLGPIKEQEPENIGDPGDPDSSGRAVFVPPGLFVLLPFAGAVIVEFRFLVVRTSPQFAPHLTRTGAGRLNE